MEKISIFSEAGIYSKDFNEILTPKSVFKNKKIIEEKDNDLELDFRI